MQLVTEVPQAVVSGQEQAVTSSGAYCIEGIIDRMIKIYGLTQGLNPQGFGRDNLID